MRSSDNSSSGQAPLEGRYGGDVVPLGQLLKRAREQKGLTLEQVANETRIPKRHLAALECDDLSALPNGFYRRAQIRAFAQTVSLDQDVALGRLNRQGATASKPSQEVPAEPAPSPEPTIAAAETTTAVPIEPPATAPFILSRGVGVAVVLLLAAMWMARLVGGLGSGADDRTGQDAAAVDLVATPEPTSSAGVEVFAGPEVSTGAEVPAPPEVLPDVRRAAGQETSPGVQGSDGQGPAAVDPAADVPLAPALAVPAPVRKAPAPKVVSRAARSQAARNPPSRRAGRAIQDRDTPRQPPAQTADKTQAAVPAQTAGPTEAAVAAQTVEPTPTAALAQPAEPPQSGAPAQAAVPARTEAPTQAAAPAQTAVPSLPSAPPVTADAAARQPAPAEAKRPVAAASGRAAAAPKTQLVLQTLPGGARVTVNGVASGTSPTTIRNVSPGRTRIRVVKNGYATQDLVIRLAEGRSRRLTIRLRKTR
jgi:cytoskeleton protein RodZ